MAKTLKEKTVSALMWSFVDKFGQQLLFLVISVVLARLLSPAEFGTIGVLAIFTAVASVLIDSGFGYSLIREKDVRDIDFSTTFVTNVVMGVGIYTILFFAAPLIPLFYNKPIPVTLIRVLFLSIPISAFGVIQSVYLIKNIRFEIIARINLISLLISGSTSITLALNGFGVWALVFQAPLQALCRTCLLWFWSKWRVSFKFDIGSFKRSYGFSVNYLLTSLFNVIYNNIYASLVGKYFSLQQVGYYSQAGKVADIPDNTITGTIKSTMFPIMSSIHDDDERFKRAARKTIRTCSFLAFPVFVGLICVAKPAFLILLSDKWAASIPYFQLLCCAGMFLPFTSINNNFLYAKGHSSTVLKLEVTKIFVALVVVFFTLRYGIIYMLIGQIGVRLLYFYLAVYTGGRRIHYSLAEQLKDMLPYAAISAGMAIILYLYTLCIDNLFLLLILQIITGAVFYIVANKLLGSKIFSEVIDIFKKSKV